MPGIEITIQLDSAELERALDRAIAGGSNLSQPMRQIAAEFLMATHERFDEERDPLGIPWKQSQRAKRDGGKTLWDTGELFSNIIADSGEDYALVGVARNAGLARAKSSVKDYAAIHQFGGTITRRNKKAGFGAATVSQIVMPARPYLGFGDVEQERTTDILGNFFRDLFSPDNAG